MEIMGITSVAAIVIICLLLAEALKASNLDNKWLPTICGVMGALCGVAAFFVMPGFPAEDLMSAVAVGIVSGLAATGGYEAVHQLKDAKEQT